MKSDFPLLKAFSVILSRQKPPALYEYLEEILTDKERQFVERRLRIARLLLEEKSYMAIQKELKVSAATVASVSDQLAKRPIFAKLMTQVEKEVDKFQWFKQRK